VVCSSALDSFEEIIELAKGKFVTLFLDYDGTVSCIVNNPDKAFMSNKVKTANILNPEMRHDPYNTYCFLLCTIR
jgi:trehalose-6-phosphatase